MSLTSTTWHRTQAAPIGVLTAATAVRRTVGGHGKTDNHQETRSTAMSTIIEMQARHQIQERVARASARASGDAGDGARVPGDAAGAEGP